jgi:hypothetical protein
MSRSAEAPLAAGSAESSGSSSWSPLAFSGTFGGTKRVVKAGDKLKIKFENANMANGKARIRIDNGKGKVKYVDVPLDEHGAGEADFDVPADWVVVKLNHATAQEHAIIVDA